VHTLSQRHLNNMQYFVQRARGLDVQKIEFDAALDFTAEDCSIGSEPFSRNGCAEQFADVDIRLTQHSQERIVSCEVPLVGVPESPR